VPDNQGDWIGTSPLYHVEKGKFYGHPASLTWKPKETRPPLTIPIAELDKSRTPAAVLFPQNLMANSPAQPFTDTTEGKFGPFAGQLMIGEMNHNSVLRVVLEEVDGQLQGMAVPLLNGHGLRKGNNRFAFAPDGSLWVGQTDHGWPGEKGIQRVAWTGKAPLDVKEMHLTKSGFEMVFTQPLEAASAGSVESYPAQRYYYEYHAAYGSKQFELEKIKPAAVTVSEDRMKVTLEFDPLTAWRVYQFNLAALKAEDGTAIANPMVVYTLNHLREHTPPPPPPGPGPGEEEKKVEKTEPAADKEKAKAAVEETKAEQTKPETKPSTEEKPPAHSEGTKPEETKPEEPKTGEKSATDAKPAEKASDGEPAEGAKTEDKKPKVTSRKPSTPAAKPTAKPSTPTPTPKRGFRLFGK
jgi:hypothetical protein